MAQAIFSGLLADRRPPTEIVSAGLLPAGRPMAPEALAAVEGSGRDMRGHRSRTVSAAEISQADLVLGMTRAHVREVIGLVPGSWSKSFTLKELVRRGELRGSRVSGQALGDWLESVGRGRQRQDLLGSSAAEDVEDPIGGSPARFSETAEELRDLCQRLVALLDL